MKGFMFLVSALALLFVAYIVGFRLMVPFHMGDEKSNFPWQEIGAGLAALTAFFNMVQAIFEFRKSKNKNSEEQQ